MDSAFWPLLYIAGLTYKYIINTTELQLGTYFNRIKTKLVSQQTSLYFVFLQFKANIVGNVEKMWKTLKLVLKESPL